ncbi:DUF6625 family protein [Halopseudomonas laoshanensis]|jgi:hypothetical protein|uniref:DUF6625 family protein n=1 Tax=Halopseudomonas TaxID=2901189 RepID=UPI003734C6D8|tara:strand:+ start:16 stop:900 length:885 start_codon:yes stop_codon:yes gene_type:complete
MNTAIAIQPSIRFVIPYFGSWPFWMAFYLESCRRNPTVEWLFFTDCGIPDNPPDNVRFIEMSYRAYCELVSARLGIDFYPERPYKLCDIKPALGYIHADQLGEVDFWAFGDIDVIYGDLRGYFTAERLATKDLFATHHRRISGHLCLVRNTVIMREAFMRIPRWRERYADPAHQALDEGAFSRLFIRHKNWPESLRLFAARFNAWSRRSEFIESHSTFTILANGRRVLPQKWFLRDGRLTNSELNGVELPYLHFLAWKNQSWKELTADSLRGPDGLAFSANWDVSQIGWRDAEL